MYNPSTNSYVQETHSHPLSYTPKTPLLQRNASCICVGRDPEIIHVLFDILSF